MEQFNESDHTVGTGLFLSVAARHIGKQEKDAENNECGRGV
jgi:hypothetical protein